MSSFYTHQLNIELVSIAICPGPCLFVLAFDYILLHNGDNESTLCCLIGFVNKSYTIYFWKTFVTLISTFIPLFKLYHTSFHINPLYMYISFFINKYKP